MTDTVRALAPLDRLRLPSPQRGIGVRGGEHRLEFPKASEILIHSRVSGVDLVERYPPHPPAPLPRWGEGRRSRVVAVSDQFVAVSLLFQSVISCPKS